MTKLSVLLNKMRNLVETYNRTAKGEEIKSIDLTTVRDGSETLNFIDENESSSSSSSDSESE